MNGVLGVRALPVEDEKLELLEAYLTYIPHAMEPRTVLTIPLHA